MRILRFLIISGKQLFINYNYYMNISQNSEIISSLIQKEQSIIFCSIAIFSVFWQLEKQEQIIFSLVNAFRFPTSRFSCHIKPITRGAVSDSASRCHCWWIKWHEHSEYYFTWLTIFTWPDNYWNYWNGQNVPASQYLWEHCSCSSLLHLWILYNFY